jgi:3-polyprenyl-4-hydroxybenzoate decarboxylase
MNVQPVCGIDATKKIPGEGFKRAWPPLIKMDDPVKAKIDSFVDKNNYSFSGSK